MAWIKHTLIALLVVFLLLAGAVAWLLAGVDVNQYKPQLEQLAAEQGVALKLDGDIGWQLWPNIALELEGVQLAPLPQPDEPLVRAERVAVGVALMPLLKRRVEAKEIVLLGPQIDLSVDEQGRGNWERITEAMEEKQKQRAEEPPELEVPREGEQQALDLALEKLRLEDGRLSYRDAGSDTEYSVEQLRVSADNLVPGGEPGRIEASAEMTGSALKQPVLLQLTSTLALDEGLNGLRLQPATIDLSSGEAAASINLRGHVRRSAADRPWQIQMQVTADAEPLRPWLAVTGTELTTQSASALQKLSLETSIEGTDKKFDLSPLQLELDGTRFTGNAQVRNANIPGLDLTLRGDTLVVDDYLPPPSPEAEQPQEPEAAAEPTPLPLTAMRGFKANLDLSLKQLRAVDLQMDNPQLQLTVDNGLYQLQKLAADLYGGELNTDGRFNARGQSAEATLNGGLTNVEISRVQQALFPSDRVKVSGKSSVTWEARTSGADTRQLQKQLRGTVQVSSDQLALAPFNLEKGMCQLIELAQSGGDTGETEQPQRQWPASTRLQDLRANITIEGDKVTVQEILAGVEKIALTGDGDVDLEEGNFDFALGLAVVGERTSADGCRVTSDRWRNHPLPLRCKDSFADASATSCKPDSRRIGKLLGEAAKQEAKQKVEEKYGEKLKEKTEELKDKFKGLFGND
ncbi:AsmA family protein [Microbulbifer halophilus]|uniref:AsmA family protein n=1 Tax=Microbulbifer halophilus TaxID=453963 RepID=A0ABW5ECQ9_9GAMM|nr:AsmA family protein [Microbulbifer halophilus]MCW8126259.1 AsmA family protein [Microbulbifer halophilus]